MPVKRCYDKKTQPFLQKPPTSCNHLPAELSPGNSRHSRQNLSVTGFCDSLSNTAPMPPACGSPTCIGLCLFSASSVLSESASACNSAFWSIKSDTALSCYNMLQFFSFQPLKTVSVFPLKFFLKLLRCSRSDDRLSSNGLRNCAVCSSLFFNAVSQCAMRPGAACLFLPASKLR